MTGLREAWESQAANWLAFARPGGPDHSFWEVNWPAFESLLPRAGRATLDVGCGDGRVGVRLRELGHTATAVDASPTLAAAARARDAYADVVEADAASLPFADGAFDLVIAFMSLQDVDDAAGAVREIGRVLEPGGRAAIAIVHPTWSARTVGDYFATERYDVAVEREGVQMVFSSMHRPLERWMALLRAAGLLVEDIREPRPTAEQAQARPRWRDETQTPASLQLLARAS